MLLPSLGRSPSPSGAISGSLQELTSWYILFKMNYNKFIKIHFYYTTKVEFNHSLSFFFRFVFVFFVFLFFNWGVSFGYGWFRLN